MNTAKFTQERELYNSEGYVEAFGTWHPTNEKLVAARWEADGDKIGFPNSYGKEQWFVVAGGRTKSHLQGLLADDNANQREVLEALKEVV